MNTVRQAVRVCSRGEDLAAMLFLPGEPRRVPALIVCHGAGEFKENYFDLCEALAQRGVATLAVDMNGHGESAGERFNVQICRWVADVQAGLDYLQQHPQIDADSIGAFGLSSGGTAILEAAIVDPRLKLLVALDATVRNSLPIGLTLFLKLLLAIGKVKKWCTKSDLRIPLAKLSGGLPLTSDPEIQRRLESDPRAVAAYMSFPFPGGAEAFFVNTLERVSRIKAPTLVLWGEDDKIDPPETGRLLFDALACEKQLHIIPGNGHAGHLDRHRDKVFALTGDWVVKNFA